MKLTVLPDSPWHSDGLAFTCTQCGNCCTGDPGYVWITEPEIKRLAEHLQISVDDVINQYCRRIGSRFSLRERRTPQGQYDCIFLIEAPAEDGAGIRHTRRVCSVYSARPTQCRTWPFWKENLVSESAWNHASRKCPGIGRGKIHSKQKIEAHMNTDERI